MHGAIEGIGRSGAPRAGTRGRGAGASGLPACRTNGRCEPCRRPWRRRRRRSASHAGAAGARRRDGWATREARGTATTCWRRWPTCSARLLGTAMTGRRCSAWRSWPASVPPATDRRLAADRRRSRAIGRARAARSNWRAGPSEQLTKPFRVSLLKLPHAPLAGLAPIAISPRKCDPGRAGGSAASESPKRERSERKGRTGAP